MCAFAVCAVADRDPDLMAALKSYFKSLEVDCVDLDPASDYDGNKLATYLTKKQVKVILPKVLSSSKSQSLFKKLRKTKLHFLNSPSAVEICSRRRTLFSFLERKMSSLRKAVPTLAIPKVLKSWGEVKRAFKKGRAVWVRQDAHNIPKEERVLGIATNLNELYQIVRFLDPRSLFFQEYLGVMEVTFKAYVIGEKVFALKKTGFQDGYEQGPVTVERVELPRQVRHLLLKLGRLFDMTVYGVDFAHVNGSLVLFDVNDFPSFRGIDEAVETICAHVNQRFLTNIKPLRKEKGKKRSQKVGVG